MAPSRRRRTSSNFRQRRPARPPSRPASCPVRMSPPASREWPPISPPGFQTVDELSVPRQLLNCTNALTAPLANPLLQKSRTDSMRRITPANRGFEQLGAVCLLDRAGAVSMSQKPVFRQIGLTERDLESFAY